MTIYIQENKVRKYHKYVKRKYIIIQITHQNKFSNATKY